jgi:leucyl aminopeptidase (aminopeptidase T)
MSEELIQSAEITLFDCCNLKRSEKLLILCDIANIEIGRALFEAGDNRCKEAVMVVVSPRKNPGMELPLSIHELFKKFEVVILSLSKLITAFQPDPAIDVQGPRFAFLTGLTPDVFMRAMTTDWRKIGVFTRKVAAKLSYSQMIRVTTAAGTDFTFESNSNNPVISDDGRISLSGVSGSLPGGRAFMVPSKGTLNGTIVIDGSVSIVSGELESPFIFTVENDVVISVKCPPENNELEKTLTKFRNSGRIVSEFGVGTLDAAIVSGFAAEDKFARGTCYLTFGKKVQWSGVVGNEIPLFDAVIRNPTIQLDEKVWMAEGNVL